VLAKKDGLSRTTVATDLELPDRADLLNKTKNIIFITFFLFFTMKIYNTISGSSGITKEDVENLETVSL
jgi:hypothetical protein